MSTIITDEFPYTAHYVQALLNISQEELDHYIETLRIAPQADSQTGRLIFSHRDIDTLKRNIPNKPGRSVAPTPVAQPVPTIQEQHTFSSPNEIRPFGTTPTTPSYPDPTPTAPSYMEPSRNEAYNPAADMRPEYKPDYKPEPKFEPRAEIRQEPRQDMRPAYPPERRPEPVPAYTVAPPPPSPITPAPPRPVSASNLPTNRPTGAMAAPSRDAVSTMVETVSQVKDSILKDMSRMLDDKLTGLDDVVVELIRCKSENDSLRRKLDDLQGKLVDMEEELTCFVPIQFGFYRKDSKR